MLTAEDAAELVCDGETLAFGSFTAAGTPTAVSKALATASPTSSLNGYFFRPLPARY